MRLGLAQTEPLWEDKRGNFEKAEYFLQEAREKEVDLLLFPEMSMTGFSMHPEKIGEERGNFATLEHFRERAKAYGMYVGVGYVEYRQPKSYNCYAILGPEGELLADYRKIHPFTFGTESVHYTGGEEIVSCRVKEFTVAPFICYDLRFPEIFQIASREAGLIVVPANWPSERREQFMTLLKARAIENQCYVAGINRVGRARTLSYRGDSVVADPFGQVIAKGGSGEMIVTADLDGKLVEDYRREFPAKKDRRDDLYMLHYMR